MIETGADVLIARGKKEALEQLSTELTDLLIVDVGTKFGMDVAKATIGNKKYDHIKFVEIYRRLHNATSIEELGL